MFSLLLPPSIPLLLPSVHPARSNVYMLEQIKELYIKKTQTTLLAFQLSRPHIFFINVIMDLLCSPTFTSCHIPCEYIKPINSLLKENTGAERTVSDVSLLLSRQYLLM